MSVMAKLAYKPVGVVAGAGASLLAGMVFKQVWRGISGGETQTPRAIDEDRAWAEILLAALLQGAIFGIVRAAVDRASAEAVRRATGEWPD
jgi:hypothetical protein